MVFTINNKKELLITYPTNYCEQLNKTVLVNFFKNLKDNNNNQIFDYIISEETGSCKFQDHFHIYLNYIGPKKRGFYTRNHEFFDLTIEPIISFYLSEDENYIEDQKLFSFFQNNEENIKKYLTDNNYSRYKIISSAHPNIKFKSNKKDDYCADTEQMIEYVTKEDKNPLSSFDWKQLLEDIKKNKKKSSQKRKDDLEEDLILFIRDQILNHPNITRNELFKLCVENKDFCIPLMRKFDNYKKIFDYHFGNPSSPKPKIDYNKKFWVPSKLYEYLIYLDKWVMESHLYPEKKEHRPKGLVLTGNSRSGKTSLMLLFGPCSYFKNVWNANDHEELSLYNIFDDFEVVFEKIQDFSLYKGWFGAQDVLTITDKYKPKIDINNGKPIIFINNNKFDDIFINDKVKKYVKDNCEIIELNDEDLINPKNRSTLGGFFGWTCFDPKSTWWYQNKIYPTDENKENILLPLPLNGERTLTIDEEFNLPSKRSLDDYLDEPEVLSNQPTIILSSESDDDLPPANSNILGRQITKKNKRFRSSY